jgi:hypothetical protein
MWTSPARTGAHKLPVALLLSSSVLLSQGRALGQAANTAAAAEALFSQARDLVAAGKYAEACPKFAESQRLDPGTGTLMNLAACYEKADLLASAWTTWIEATRSAKAAGQTDREAHASRSASALAPRLAKLTLEVQADPPEGLVIKRNGVELAPATWGIALPVDKGRYRIEASAPGYRTATLEATVENGQTHNLVVPRLTKSGEVAPEPQSPPAEVEKSPLPAPSTSPTEDQKSGGSPGQAQRVLGIVGLSLGGVGLAVGGVSGILAMTKFNESKSQCEPANINQCSPLGVETRDQALMFGDVSTVAFSVGGALALTGFVLLVTAPRAHAEVSLAPTPGGLFFHYGAKF